ncbi:hypothetical protein RND71_006372 [Anisodus tanguticus]|uniref:Uncharacterized protein n=1 Tax=Anisodus tanguticus TaxID=243964 RepID=A0AAE1STU1_9SOLA|nr:hypothetical protein RND71_006372 [Anisodus tanguticus]
MPLFATNTRYSLVKGERIIRYVFIAWLREFCHRERALYMVLFLCRTFGVGFTAYWISEARFMSAPNEDNISQPQVNVYKNHQMYSVCERTHNHSDDVNLGRPCQTDQPQIRLVSSISSSYSHIPGSREHQSEENEGV